MTLETWISKHPYLRPIAEFHARLSGATATIPLHSTAIPNWHDYAGDYKRGVPFLKSISSGIDSGEIEGIISSLLGSLMAIPLHEKLRGATMELSSEFQSDSRRMVAWLFGNENYSSSHLGLFRHIGWTAVSQYLAPLRAAFEQWRDEESWIRGYCPICSSGPSMGQLVGADPGRRRLLVCGCCKTRWQFLRIGCPFCGNGDDRRLSALSVDQERQLRIDYCSSCSGYLKTYNGEGQENLMLADWTSLHLDFLAKDRGLKRLATSLYEL